MRARRDDGLGTLSGNGVPSERSNELVAIRVDLAPDA